MLKIKPYLVNFLVVLVISFICWLVYSAFNLGEMFHKEPTYLQWVAINLIATLIFPRKIDTDDPKGA